MKLHWSILPIIIVGVAIGTLIALYISALVAKQQIQQSSQSSPLLAALAGV